jgi:ATP-binding protein involved in chromosome partitioning
MNITREQVLGALKNVEDPDLKKDLVTLGMIKDL